MPDVQRTPTLQREVVHMLVEVHHELSLGEDAAAGSTAFNQFARDAGTAYRGGAALAPSGQLPKGAFVPQW